MRRSLALLVPGATLLCCAEVIVPVKIAAPAPVAAMDASTPDVALAEESSDHALVFLEAGPDGLLDDDPMALHRTSPDALRALMGAASTLELPIGGGPWHPGQGNRAIARHAVGHRACLAGLRDVTVQTPEQRALCGADAMVPIWQRGEDMQAARTCIDVFEFPNLPCELPFVFVTPPQAEKICRAQGKRLCSQDEWDLACRGDPNGGADRVYAYGNELDLTVCNTNKSRERGATCDVSTPEKLWTTCGTDTEPSGSFPRCRSRFGVFDQHGNVAEIMTRFEPADGEVKTQLKGSAFFYVEVAKKPDDPGGYWTRYPDHCNFDPRWHVEKLETAGHMNYHLGFRCCRSLDPRAARDASEE